MPVLEWRRPENRALHNESVAGLLADLPEDERAEFLGSLSDEEALRAIFTWELWARPNQLEPEKCPCVPVHSGVWRTWLIMAGRGFGKTRTGAEWIRKRQESGKFGRFALIGRSAADVRDVMVEGESGILNISPPWNRPIYQSSRRRVEWPNGAYAILFSADEPDQLRGPQHDSAWCDEIASWRYPEAWDQLQFGLRLGVDPRTIATTTPRPTKFIREIASSPFTHITPGATLDNLQNLAPAFIDQIIKKYQGTRLGRQELEGILLDDIEGALWVPSMFEERKAPDLATLKRIVVALDPSVKEDGKGAEAGIIVAGLDHNNVGYILGDRTTKSSPKGWAEAAIAAFDEFRADRVVAEINNGGAIVEALLRTIRENIPYLPVHASRGKQPRAEPIVSLYEQKRVFHAMEFPALEEQLTTWTPSDKDSPDRLDALVWALTDLMVTPPEPTELKGVGFASAKGWFQRTNPPIRAAR